MTRAAPVPARAGTARRPVPVTSQTSLDLRPADTAPRTARATLRAALAVWGLAYLTDPAELITSDSLN